VSDALHRWNELYAMLNGRTTAGQAGVRDPEHPCRDFDPGEPSGNCEGDGHYLCGECAGRVVGCPVCGRRPVVCECLGCSFLRCGGVAVFLLNRGVGYCADHLGEFERRKP
jgi:hypothetical protein